jgi:Zn-dependent peptidase ImmA (M78 family)
MTATAQLSLFEQYRFGDPSLSDEQVVEAIARQVLADADAEPPVDVNMLASVCGIAKVEFKVQIPAGMLFQREGRLVASVRAGDGLERGRFTVLHEGGHTFQKGYRRATQYRCLGQKNHEEHLCDVAAAEMLFPRAHFLHDLAQAGPTLEGVGLVAPAYLASIQATAMRLVALSEHPTALLVFKYAHKPAEAGREHACPPKLRLQWSSTQGTWPFLRTDKSVSAGSPIARAWEGEIVDEAAKLDEVAGPELGAVRVEARRYGDSVLALVRRSSHRRQ